MFSAAEESGEKFLVHLTQNHLTKDRKRLFEALKSSPIQGNLILQIGRNPKEHLPSRKVNMVYHYERIPIQKPKRRKEEHSKENLSLTAIYIHETIRKENLHWFFITNKPVKTGEDAEKLIQNYLQRWKIERFHSVLKSGCKIKEKQARSYETLKKLTLLYSVIAFSILNLTYMGQICPELPAEQFFEEWKWKVLYCTVRKARGFPHGIYTIRDALYDLATLSGMKGAPSDGIP